MEREWSSEPPKVPGYYWRWFKDSGHAPEIVRVAPSKAGPLKAYCTYRVSGHPVIPVEGRPWLVWSPVLQQPPCTDKALGIEQEDASDGR